MRSLLRLTLLGTAFALATVALGWMAVPAVGIVWGFIASATRRPALTAGAAALFAWAILLTWTAFVGRLSALLERMGGILDVPGSILLIATLILAGVLAALGALVGAEIRRMFLPGAVDCTLAPHSGAAVSYLPSPDDDRRPRCRAPFLPDSRADVTVSIAEGVGYPWATSRTFFSSVTTPTTATNCFGRSRFKGSPAAPK
jgi:hypothetical protein